jgi:hypothetical protein
MATKTNLFWVAVVIKEYSKYYTRLTVNCMGNMPGASGELVFPPDAPVLGR